MKVSGKVGETPSGWGGWGWGGGGWVGGVDGWAVSAFVSSV